MNHAYRLVWNEVHHRYIPAPETAKGRGKHTGRSLRRSVAVMALGTSLLSLGALAGPTGGTVSAGSGSISQSGTATTVTQGSQNLAINWASFSTASGESVNFVQPNSSAIALNRVTGSQSSVLYGSLSANGQVWILNPNGVLFGSTASVNVGGLVASTLSLSDADFLAGKRSFTGDGTQGSVVNQGSLTAGYVALLGKQVSNTGSITTANGMASLAAGDKITLDFSGNQLLSVQIDEGTFNALVENKGLIRADNGTVILTASAKDALLDTVVNNEGIIEARGIDGSGGSILLLGGFNGGTVKVGGTLDASANGAHNGGFIETSGAHVQVADGAKISTLSDTGKTGTWLIDPTDFTISSGSGSQTTSGMGATTLSNNLASNNISLTTDNSTGTDSGDINVNAAVSWSANTTLTLNAYNNINVNAAITATGTSAGLVLNYGDYATAGSVRSGTDYVVNAPVTLSGAGATLTMNGTAYTLIHSMADLAAATGSGAYALAQDLNAGSSGSYSAAVLGSLNGTLAGLGHSVSDLSIVSTDNQVGLIGVNRGVLRDIGVASGSVQGDSWVGALVGDNEGSISNAYASASVTGVNGFIGGLVGKNTGSISNAYASGSVTGGGYVGGLVGWNAGGSISSAYASGSVTGSDGLIGGLVGESDGSISNVYATGNVSGDYEVGGLVGTNHGSIDKAYASGSVSGNSNVGGLVGVNGGSITSAYWDSTTTGQNVDIGLDTGSGDNLLTVPTAYNHSSYSNLGTWTETVSGSGVWVAKDGSGNKLWVIVEGATRPFLYSEYSTSIHNAHQLQLMAYDLGASYTLSANVDASETSGSNASGMWTTSGFSPVGNSTVAFSGSLDGESHTIADLTINRSSTDNVGLFGEISGNINNLGLVGGSVSGYGGVGGLVGTNNGSISNAYTSGSVTGVANVGGLVAINNGSISNAYASGSVSGAVYVGGLVGYNNGTISNAYATGSVAGSNHVGGLVGRNNSGSISTAHATGNVAGTDNVGGLVGGNYGSISTSVATGAVSGANTVGGLVGYTEGSISGSSAHGAVSGDSNVGGLVGTTQGSVGIDASFAVGAVTGTGSQVGGLVGELRVDGSVTNSYATSGAVQGLNNVGGLVGSNHGSISNSRATRAVSGDVSVGGLVGTSDGSINGNGSDSYAAGVVTGTSDVGGLVGYSSGSINNSYAAGPVTGTATAIGGLVGSNHGSVSNSHASGSVSGDGDVGGLVGWNSSAGSISNTYALGGVAGTNGVGGLVGGNAGSISNAYATGSVSGDGYTGGLAGYNSSGASISNAYASGGVSANYFVGGLVGENDGSIGNAYASGSVSGSDIVGGLVGFNSSGASISNTYATGNASGNGNKIGALVGHNDAGGTVTASFWLSSVSTTGVGLQDGSIDSITRDLSASEASSASTYTAAGWDVATVGGSSSVWRSYDGSSMPLLRSFLTALTVTTGDVSKTYDGTTGLSGSYSLSDSGADTSLILGTASYSSTSSQNVGSYSVGTSGLYSGQQGYDISYVNGTATITRASLTVSANDASKTADGTAYSGGNGVSYSGLVNGETSSVLGGNLVYGGTAQGATAAGSYSLSASGLSAGNYALTYVDGALVINAAAATTTNTTGNTPLNQAQQSLQATQPGTTPVAASALATEVPTNNAPEDVAFASASLNSGLLNIQACGMQLATGLACH